MADEDVELGGVVFPKHTMVIVNTAVANLARLEIAEALKTVTRRMTNPRKTGPSPWKPMVSLSGPTSLPIAFDA